MFVEWHFTLHHMSAEWRFILRHVLAEWHFILHHMLAEWRFILCHWHNDISYRHMLAEWHFILLHILAKWCFILPHHHVTMYPKSNAQNPKIFQSLLNVVTSSWLSYTSALILHELQTPPWLYAQAVFRLQRHTSSLHSS